MAIQTETDLGKVAIMPKGEWVIGVLYEILDMVTHNGNLYLSLKDTSVEPTDDGINWMLLMEGVPVATDTILGKVKPDGKTITIENGTLHGASQVPEGVTYVDLEAENQELQTKLPVDADTLEGHAAEYFATKKDLENIETSGGGEVTFPLEVPNSKEIKFIGIQVPNNHFASEILDHILYKDKNALVLKTVDEKNKEKELIRVYEDDFGNSVICFEPYWIDMVSTSLKVSNMSLVDTNEDEITVRAVATDNGSGLEICKDGSVYETLLEIDGDGISHFFHSIDIKSGNLNLNNSNVQIVNFKNYKITQNGNDDFFVISQNNNIGAFIQFSNSQNQINLHKNINSLHEFFAHELIKCYVNKGIHFAQAGTVYHVYQKGQSGELLFDVVNLLNGSRTNVIDCNLDGTVTFTKKIKVLSDNPDYAALIEVNDCNFMLKGGTESSFSAFMSVDLDSNEMTVYGDLVLNEGNKIYIGPNIALGTRKINNIPTTNFGVISIDTAANPASSGIYFSDGINKPLWQIVQNQHVAQGEWFLDFYYNDIKNNSRNRLMHIGQNEMRVGIPLVAPNVSKMASDIVTVQQEITEQDLQLIETQQMLTDQELENIETQQMLTEMDLERIEGGQAL